MAWPPEFRKRRDIDISLENKPYIESFGELTETDDEDQGVIRAFMRHPGDSDICQPAADLVEKYCSGRTLETLRAERTGLELNQLPRVALLDERCFQDGEQGSRAYRGPLTAYELYRELKKSRFRCHSPVPSVGTRDTSEPSQTNSTTLETTFAGSGMPEGSSNESEQQSWECDAERRLIFITDLDQWTIHALIGTVSLYQAPALRYAFYSHLAFETFMGVTLSVRLLRSDS
jgi:hypothetical protein